MILICEPKQFTMAGGIDIDSLSKARVDKLIDFKIDFSQLQGFVEVLLNSLRRTEPSFGWRVCAAMPEAEQSADLLQEPLPKASRDTIRESRQELHVTNEMGPAELKHRVRLAKKLAVGRMVVAADNALKGLAKKLLQHLRTSRRIDVIPSESLNSRCMEAPRPTH